MDDRDENTKKLWEHFAEIKQSFSFSPLFFLEIPEFDINSPQEILEMFDSLDDQRKQEYASLFGRTPDEFRATIEEEWEQGVKDFLGDIKHPYATQYEAYFYRIIDPIIEDIKVAAKSLDLESEDNFIIGLLPTREINAVAIKAPNNIGSIIGINFGTMLFLSNVGKLFNKFYVKLRNYLKNPNVHVENDLVEKYIQESIPKCIDESTNQLFIDLVVSYFLAGLPTFSITRPSMQESLFDPSEGSYGNEFTDLVIPFILCHEYAHFCIRAKDVDDFLTRYYQSLDPSEQEDAAYELSRESVEEIMADKLGFDLLIEVALIYYGMPEPNSDLLIAALGRAYSGMNTCLCCLEILEKAQLVIFDKGHNQNDPHLPAQTRRESLARRTLGELRVKGYPISSIALHGRIFESFINTLWENNKDKIKEVFVNGKQRLD
jgi:hypothetical protein